MDIPVALINQIQEGNCVLFLGSGANYGSLNPAKESIPLGQTLADLIAKKFLSPSYLGSPLASISELAISETDLFTVQKFIADIFNKYTPCSYHKNIPSFVWKAIFTTNYDVIIENTYSAYKSSPQELSPVVKNSKQEDIFKNTRSLPYYKLHGCITNINDPLTPLILTPEQYINHKRNRGNLFDTLQELAFSHPFIFAGYSMADPNIRAILTELGESLDVRPRSYLINPGLKAEEIRLWDSKKIAAFPVSFEEFLNEIDNKISINNRLLAKFRPQLDHPIHKKFVVDVSTLKPTDSFLQFLNQEIDFIHPNFPTGHTKAEAFYKGYFENWDAIAANLDVTRGVTNSIISEVVFEDQYNSNDHTFLFLIQGQAGSGKSVLLKRIAWNAAIDFDKLCIYLKPGSNLLHEPIAELYNYTKERIFLFIDGIAGREEIIKKFLDKCKAEKTPVTIIATERTNVWNTDCQEIQKYLTQSYTLRYLSDKEIEALLKLLERHNCLGLLAKQSMPDRIKSLSERNHRELLVALYEATQGLPFEDIIHDEYVKINNEAAKSMYLTVCILHRIGASARAGLIARVHGINFNEFKAHLFKPLEFIVFDKMDYHINDYVYLTRHKQIADIVFERVLITPQDRYDAYVSVITYLNTDFESDRIACLAMTNAKKLNAIFSDPIMVRNLFDIADENNPNNPKIKQQRAIYEMQIPGGSLVVAEKHLLKAAELSPGDRIITHSFAELAFKKAEKSSYIIQQNQYLQESIEICTKLIRRHNEGVYPYHTILKVYLFKLERELKNEGITTIENIVKDFERVLNLAKQHNPDDEMIVGIEVSFNELFEDMPTAKLLLKKAYDVNKGSPYLSLRYSTILKNEGNLDEAISILSETLKLSPNDRDVNLKYGTYLSIKDDVPLDEIKQYLRRSFTKGDNRYMAQFWYARALYLNNEISESRTMFDQLSDAKINYEIKNSVRGILSNKGVPIKFSGIIKKVETSFGFIQRDVIGTSIYFRPLDNQDNWNVLEQGNRINFELGFTFKGAIAINITQYKNGN